MPQGDGLRAGLRPGTRFRALCGAAAVITGSAWAVPVLAAQTAPPVSAPAAVLLDVASGRVLVDKGGEQLRRPASMAKIMTLVLALRAMNAGRVRPTDLVAVSDEAYRTGGSQIWLEPGEVLPFGHLLTAVAVGSANDAAVALAEHLAGSMPAFVDEMNATAGRLGMRHTRFVNPNGLDAPGEETLTTAMDMARLGAYAASVPGLLRLTRLREDRTIRDGKGGHLWLVNTNRLLGRVAGVDGLKTGYTSRAGFCLTATGVRDGLRLVAVVMGATTSKARFGDASTLLNWGFAHYRAVFAARTGVALGQVPVRGGKAPGVAVGVVSDVSFLRPAGEPTAPRRRVHLPASVSAPVRKGTVVGELVATLNGQTRRVPLVALTDVARATPLDLLRRFAGLAPGERKSVGAPVRASGQPAP